jgi:hypothetical protein
MDRLRFFRVLTTLAVSFFAGRASAAIVVTAEAPGVQSSQVPGVTTETFDSFAAGHYTSISTAVGLLTSPDAVVSAASQFGGAGGNTHYLAVQNVQIITLALPAPQTYFGMWWSAADLGNIVNFYSGPTLVGTFVPAGTFAALGDSYKGNPNPAFPIGDPTEKFAYLNFVGTGGTTFDTVVFRNTDSSTAFEIDNLSIPGSATPEPSSLFVSGGLAALVAIGAVRRRRALTNS